jgi:hypothetical protein
MWVTYFFVGYLALGICVPVGLALAPVWRRRSGARQVSCPATKAMATITLDRWHAVRRHALGDSELRVKSCTCWPDRCDCEQDCLQQIERAG